jgi:hypothetical protein
VKPDVERSSGGGSIAEQGSGSEDRGQDKSQDHLVIDTKPNHLVLAASGQKKTSRTTTPRTVPAPCWCRPGLTPSQKRRIQWMRAQKMREEVVEKERDEYFNIIQPMIMMK